ncbi:Chromatin structure-remodeling complex subunit snf21 [Frankliniella fusca]|uniref:Chromatin structure-remodeling complex subunit snf21 n=1 Tax=Frankliniella fusca TaxID=407009 RepID=A0AAE1LVC1_9NEOP|nr:Chromatin structure-remodeling complex subunit snf21 [Frankliniella fusca]
MGLVLLPMHYLCQAGTVSFFMGVADDDVVGAGGGEGDAHLGDDQVGRGERQARREQKQQGGADQGSHSEWEEERDPSGCTHGTHLRRGVAYGWQAQLSQLFDTEINSDMRTIDIIPAEMLGGGWREASRKPALENETGSEDCYLVVEFYAAEAETALPRLSRDTGSSPALRFTNSPPPSRGPAQDVTDSPSLIIYTARSACRRISQP